MLKVPKDTCRLCLVKENPSEEVILVSLRKYEAIVNILEGFQVS